MQKIKISVLTSMIVLVGIFIGACSHNNDTGGTTGYVAMLLPENVNPRWESQDARFFREKMSAIAPDVKVEVFNANNDTAAQQRQAEQALTDGADVLVVIPIDGEVAAVIADMAAEEDVPTIAYDRMIHSQNTNFWVQADLGKSGESQAQHVVDNTKKGDTLVLLKGSPTDPNADVIYQGQLKVLQPLFDSGDRILGHEDWTPGWDPAIARRTMDQALTKLNNNVQGVVSSNDGNAGAAVASLEEQGLAGKVPVSGLDATVAALQLILLNKQTQSVWRPFEKMAEATANVTKALLDGTSTASLVQGTVKNQVNADVEFVAVEFLSVVGERGVQEVIDRDPSISKDDVCKGEAASTSFCGSSGVTTKTTGYVAMLLPENVNPRWESQDARFFREKMSAIASDVKVEVFNANNDTATQQRQAEQALTNGADVLVVIPIDGEVAAIIADMAAEEDVPTIAYDRMIHSENTNFWVQADLGKSGESQAQHVVDNTKKGDTLVLLKGSPTDPNADVIYQGQLKVLKPLFDSGDRILGHEDWTPGWDPAIARRTMDQALTKLNNNVQGVVSSNDGNAGAAVASLEEQGLAGKVPVSGLDATVAALQLILLNKQTQSVWRPFEKMAEATANVTKALLDGTSTASLVQGTVKNQVDADVEFVAVEFLSVVGERGVQEVIDRDPSISKDDVCKGEAASTSFCGGGGVTTKTTGYVAMLLPENVNPRWESQDARFFREKMSAIAPDVKVEVFNANNDTATQQRQAEQALTNGADVLVVIPIDGEVAAIIADMAAEEDVPTIAYDRMIHSENTNFWVQADLGKSGESQAQHVVDNTKKGDTLVLLKGSPTDPNADVIYQGQLKVLKPLFDSGDRILGHEDWTPGWDPAIARRTMDQALTKLNNNVQGVVSSNDGNAGAAVASLEEQGLAGKVPVSGLDATVAALQLILLNKQTQSVWRPFEKMAEATANVTKALLDGTSTASLVQGTVKNQVDADVEFVAVEFLSVVGERGVQEVIDRDPSISKDAVCKGEAASTSFCR